MNRHISSHAWLRKLVLITRPTISSRSGSFHHDPSFVTHQTPALDLEAPEGRGTASADDADADPLADFGALEHGGQCTGYARRSHG